MSAPRFSVLTAVFDPEPEHLAACLSSVADQTYTGEFEHVVVDDASTRPAVRSLLDSAPCPGRVVVRRDCNGGIVAASNDALDAATGEFVVLLDHDDVLVPDALATIAEHLDRDPGIDVAYSDHDLLRADGRLASPVYKPDFSLERLRNHNYITHLVAARRRSVVDIGGFRSGSDGAQDHDVLLRLAESVGAFHHIAEILLHWRQSPASVASDPANKPDATERQRAVVAAHLERCSIDARVEPGAYPGLVRIHRSVPKGTRVSVIIPTNGARGRVWGVERIFVLDAVASMIGVDDPRIDLDVVAVIDAGTDPVVERGLHAIAGDALSVVSADGACNLPSRINVGVAASASDYVLLLDDDTELIEPGSIAEMVGIARQRDVGMVGAKLLSDDGTLQHGGHVYNDSTLHTLFGWPGQHPGPHRLLAVERECSGVTTAAALMSSAVFDDVGGLNADVTVNDDVDLCLTLEAAGYRIVWTPHASWYHFEQRSCEHTVAQAATDTIRRRSGDGVVHDPFYNPNLMPGRSDWLERPGRSGAPPYEVLPDGRIAWG